VRQTVVAVAIVTTIVALWETPSDLHEQRQIARRTATVVTTGAITARVVVTVETTEGTDLVIEEEPVNERTISVAAIEIVLQSLELAALRPKRQLSQQPPWQQYQQYRLLTPHSRSSTQPLQHQQRL
jgi:hypothetical protein